MSMIANVQQLASPNKAAGESKQLEAPHFLPVSKRADCGVHTRVWSPPYTYILAIKQGRHFIKNDDMNLGSNVSSSWLSLISNSWEIQSSCIGLPKPTPYPLKITGIT